MKNTWILPCNPNYYDMIAHFRNNTEMIWKGVSKTAVGDIIFLYIGRPYSEIRYLCHVVETNLSQEVIDESNITFLHLNVAKRGNIIRIRLDREFRPGQFPFALLKENGLISVQSQMRATEELKKYIRTHME